MFATNSLFKRTFLLISGSLVVIVALFSFLSISNQKKSHMEVIYSEARTIAKSIALNSSDAMVVEDYSFIVQHNEKVIKDHKEIKYIIVSKKGDEGTTLINHSDGWEILEKLPNELSKMHTSKEKSSIIKNLLFSEEDIYHFSYPVIFSGIKWGWVSIGFSLEKHQNHMKQIYLNNLFLLLAILLASLLFSFILAKWLVEPILSLNHAAKQVSSGDFSVKVKVKSNDEIAELSDTFNFMVNAIKISNEKMRLYNQELEIRVDTRTKELESLNKELDYRVKEEVLKRAQQEQMLIQQSRFAAMGEMIGNIAHQWRQPLNALGLLLQNVENAYEMDILNQEYIARTVEKGNRLTNSMSQTIDDFRNFFQPNRHSEKFAISTAVGNTLDMLRSSLENNMIQVTQDIDESVYTEGFSSEFSQVLLNIINNARDALIEYNSDNRKLDIRVYKDEKYSYIEVTDNAGGIKQKIIEKIFDPYFTTKDEGKGTGIGLYMSKTIIENSMGGSLSVQNGQNGAKFTIQLKRAEGERV